jgi:hypothetical protein
MVDLDVRHGLIPGEFVGCWSGCGFRLLGAACEQYKEGDDEGELVPTLSQRKGKDGAPTFLFEAAEHGGNSFRFREDKSNHGLTRITRIRLTIGQ